MDPVAIGLALLLPVLLVRWAWRASGQPGTTRSVVVTFVLGASISVPVLLLAVPVFLAAMGIPNQFVAGVVIAFAAAAIPEEFFKYQVVRRYALKYIQPFSPHSGALFGVTASLGFAAIENIGYASQGGMPVVLFRCFTAIPMHMALGAIMGYQFSRAQIAAIRPVSADTDVAFHRPNMEAANLHIAKAFLWPMLLHGLYDAPAIVVLVPVIRTGDIPETLGADFAIAAVAMLCFLAVTVVTALRLGPITMRERQQCLDEMQQQALNQQEKEGFNQYTAEPS